MDKIIRCITSDGAIMASAIDASDIVFTAKKLHNLSRVSTAALGRLLCATSMMGNMLNAAHALGLASCWINRAREVFASDEGQAILKELGIEGDFEGIGHCVLGYSDSPAPKGAPRKEGRVFWAE